MIQMKMIAITQMKSLMGNKNIRQLLLNYMYRVEGRIDKMVDAYGFINNKLYFNH